jgi:hypothetical protein
MQMIPSSIQRGRQNRGNISLPMMAAGAFALLLVVLFAWVALSMGTPPASETVTTDVPVKL